MRRLNERAIYLLTFIISSIIAIVVVEVIKDFFLTLFIMPVIIGLCFMILNSIKFGGVKNGKN